MKIYTRKGDDGTTGLLFGGRVAKDSAAPIAYGSVDETQAFLGLARAECDGELADVLVHLERDLWVVMGELATDRANRDKLEAGTTLVTDAMVTHLERLIDSYSDRFDPPTEFVVPGQERVAALLDVARTVARRAERDSIAVAAPDGSVVAYLNRLSDLLWTLARWREGVSLPTRSVEPRVRPSCPVSSVAPDPSPEVPMAITFSATRSLPAKVDVVAVTVASDRAGDRALRGRGLPVASLKAQGFTGAADQIAHCVDADGRPTIVIGVGPSKQVDADRFRRVGAQAVRAASKVSRLGLEVLHHLDGATAGQKADSVRALAEGLVLGSYRYTEYRSAPADLPLASVIVADVSAKSATDAFTEGLRIGRAQNLARDLVNMPGGDLTPAALAEEARVIAARERLQIEVHTLAKIERLELGGLLGVNRGSTHEPRFVKITYSPRSPKGTLALVGKGITFDSGGLSIKTGEGMMTMKMDMGGAAAVLGCFAAIRAVAPRCRVIGYLPMTDNMSDGDATRPGDVLTIRNGTTVEVLNTDAEGRLILADALSLATEDRPDAIVDLATLTGAVEIALGGRIAAVMANDDAWRDRVEAAAAAAGERTWPLPLPADYRSFLDSDVADLRNISRSRGGGTITAGLFLQEFVGEGIPWAHIDIAATAWSDADDAETSKGGTGYGVRTLLELARSFTG